MRPAMPPYLYRLTASRDIKHPGVLPLRASSHRQCYPTVLMPPTSPTLRDVYSGSHVHGACEVLRGAYIFAGNVGPVDLWLINLACEFIASHIHRAYVLMGVVVDSWPCLLIVFDYRPPQTRGFTPPICKSRSRRSGRRA